jgi:serine/threonine-protein kinase
MNGQEKLLNRRYRLDHQQGSGGMAVIYKATDLALGRTVAVKILRPSLTNDHTFLVRFRQEARNVANLSHPNIVTVHDVGQDGNTHYIVMEYVEGQNLKEIIRETSPIAVNHVLDLAIQICAGIGYAHRAGLVHADVKPQNILVTNEGKVKVTDFGIAQALAMTQPQERQKVVWGSPHYFSPEQAQGEYPTPASDVYSIGIVLFEMLTGNLPFVGTDQQQLALSHIRDMPPSISEMNNKVPTDLERIVMKALAKDPNARHRSADVLGRILIAYKEQGQDPTDDQASPSVTGSSARTQERIPSPQSGGSGVVSSLATAQNRRVSPANTAPGQRPYANVPPSEAPTIDGPVPAYGGAPLQPGYYGYQDSRPNMPPPPQVMSSPGYRAMQAEAIDWVTIVLALVALVAVIGVVILWIFVWQAYFS